MKLKFTRVFAACLASILCSLTAYANERKAVQWAGVSLAGDFAKLPVLMPTIYDLVARDVKFQRQLSDRLERAVRDSARAHPSLQILISDQLRQGDDSFALTFALAGESITSYVQEQTTFVDFIVQALVLVANVSKDPSRQRIVSSHPVQVKFQYAYPSGAIIDPSDRKKFMSDMLMGKAGNADVVVEWQKRLKHVRLRDKEVWISVAPLVIHPEAQKQGGFSENQAQSLAFKVSSVVEGNISRAADIPIVPTTFDGALDQMTLSFADRGIVAFRKPDPSYIFQINVYGLGSNRVERAMTREKHVAIAYGGGFEVEFFSIDPDRRRNKEFNVRFQEKKSLDFMGSHRTSNADMFTRLISGFADELSSNLIPANIKWIEQKRASSEPRSSREIAELISGRLPRPGAGN